MRWRILSMRSSPRRPKCRECSAPCGSFPAETWRTTDGVMSVTDYNVDLLCKVWSSYRFIRSLHDELRWQNGTRATISPLFVMIFRFGSRHFLWKWVVRSGKFNIITDSHFVRRRVVRTPTPPSLSLLCAKFSTIPVAVKREEPTERSGKVQVESALVADIELVLINVNCLILSCVWL